MDTLIRATMFSKHATPSSRAALINSAPNFIDNNNFTNLLQNIDVNNPAKFNYAILASFTGIPGFRDKVAKWLAENKI